MSEGQDGGGGALWDLTALVTALRERRSGPAEGRRPAPRPVQLPDQQVLRRAVEGLRAALYPHRLGRLDPGPAGPVTAEASTDAFVAHTLDTCLRWLQEQVRLERLAESDGAWAERQATAIVADFARQLPRIRALLDSDLEAAYQGDPAARSLDEVLLCYPGVKAITYHRIAHALHEAGAPLAARIIAEISHAETGVDIHPGARIGGSFFIDHGTGVVIGGTAVIGERVRLYQAVTLGAKSFPADERGVLIKGQPRHPILEDDVVVYAGATILGRVTIGRRSQIGGNVWLTRSIAADTTITQAKVVSETFGEGSGI